jgi:hypothetical protein
LIKYHAIKTEIFTREPTPLYSLSNGINQVLKFNNKMVSGMLDPEMIADTLRIVNEAIKDKIQVNLIINNRAGGNAP